MFHAASWFASLLFSNKQESSPKLQYAFLGRKPAPFLLAHEAYRFKEFPGKSLRVISPISSVIRSRREDGSKTSHPAPQNITHGFTSTRLVSRNRTIRLPSGWCS